MQPFDQHDTSAHSTLAILEKLISFDTTSCDSNLTLMDYIQSYLQHLGVNSELIYDELDSKANLYATVGPLDKPGVMLSGHTDTVPVTGQNWTTDPYTLTARDDVYYGRGTTDMKGFIAVVLAAVPKMLDSPLATPIHLAFSYDEEIGCIGVRRLIETLQTRPIKPAICIIGEPTSMQVATAHKGKLAARVAITGKECHSGMAPLGVNAINYAARLISWLEDKAFEKQSNGPFERSYDIAHTTIHTGTVQGGTALNIVPKHCSFLFEIRNIAAEDPLDILAELRAYADQLSVQMKQIDENCKIEIDITTQYPGLSTAEDADVVTFARKLAQCSAQTNINFGTEGGLFSSLVGIPTVVCGPGSMEQGHKPDEYIHLSQLQKCESFMQRLIDALSDETLNC